MRLFLLPFSRCSVRTPRARAGTYSDVFAQEPLLTESPMWHAPRLLMSSPSAGAARGVQARVPALFLGNLQAWLTGAPLVNVVPSA